MTGIGVRGKRARPVWRGVAAGTVCVLCATGAAACGSSSTKGTTGGSSSKAPITIAITSSPSATALEAIAPTFTKQTGIKVKFTTVPYEDMATKLLLNAKAHSGVWDISQYDKPFQAAVVAGGALYPLDSMIKANPSYDISDFPQKILSYQEYNGKTYGLNLSTEPFVEFYNTRLFKKAGITSPPATWTQYISDAAKLTGKGVSGSGFTYDPQGADEKFAAMLYLSGGRVLAPTTNKPLLTTPIAEQVAKEFIQLAKDTPTSAINNANGTAQVTAFEQGTEAQMVNNTGWWSDIASPSLSKVGKVFTTVAPPSATGGPYPVSNVLKGWLIGIPAYAAHKSEAEEFLMFALGKKEVQPFLAAGAPPPGRISTLTNPKYIKENAMLPVLLATEKNSIPFPALPEWSQIATILSQQLNAMAAGQTSVSSGLSKANSQISQVLSSAGLLH